VLLGIAKETNSTTYLACSVYSTVHIQGTDNIVQNVVLTACQNREEPTSGGYACRSNVNTVLTELLELQVQGTGLFFSDGKYSS